jgi:cyclin-dependent kinase-like
MKFPEISKPETIERRYLGKLSKKALNFMKSILKMNPHERMSVDEALKHPYMEGLHEEFNDQETDKEYNQKVHHMQI